MIADTPAAELLTAVSGDRVTVRTTAREAAITALARAGAQVAATALEVITISSLPWNGPWPLSPPPMSRSPR